MIYSLIFPFIMIFLALSSIRMSVLSVKRWEKFLFYSAGIVLQCIHMRMMYNILDKYPNEYFILTVIYFSYVIIALSCVMLFIKRKS